MTWQNGKKFKAPRALHISHCAAVHGEALYVKCTKYGQIFTYTISTSSWSQHSGGPRNYCSIIVINNLLTLVGGCDPSGALSNQLFSLTGEGSGRKWTEEFPPMPTKRALPISLCTGTSLIVAGGQMFRGYIIQTVEVLNTKALQWSTIANLPEKLSYTMLQQ